MYQQAPHARLDDHQSLPEQSPCSWLSGGHSRKAECPRSGVRPLRQAWAGGPLVGMLLALLLAGCSNLPLIGQPAPRAGGITVAITSPPSGARVPTGREVEIQSIATGTEQTLVRRVDMYVNNELIRSDITPAVNGQYTFNVIQRWVPTQPGTFKVYVVAHDTLDQPRAQAGIDLIVEGEGMVMGTPTVMGAGTPVVEGTGTVTGTTATPTVPISQGTPINVGGAPPNATTVQVFTPTVRSTATPNPAQAATTTGTIAATGGVLNVRNGPGTNYAALTGVRTGSQVVATGRSADGTWIRINLAGGQSGWVFAQYVRWDAPLNQLPVVP
jgi:hypothetical protein